jgi:hypothetical protein
MYELNSREEFERALIANELVIIEYYHPGSKESSILSETIKELEKHIDPNIFVCKVNVLREDITGEKPSPTPLIRVYYKGAMIFEQKGVFENLDLNVQVLRRGIRSTLASKGVKIRV